MVVNVATAPPAEPITLAEARAQCRLVPDQSLSPPAHPDDDQLTSMIAAARQTAEKFMRRAIVETVYEWKFDDFPSRSDQALQIPRNSVISVDSISYTDDNGDTQTFTQFTTLLGPADSVILPAFEQSWPDCRGHLGDVTVTFKAGFAPTDDSPPDYRANVPEDIKSALKLLVAHLYYNRSAVEIDVSPSELPMGVKALLWPYRIVGV